MMKQYDKIIRNQRASNFIERVEEQVNHNTGHYLPHHAVKKDSVTTTIKSGLQLQLTSNQGSKQSE